VTNSELRDLVRRRAGNRCEYCLLQQEHSDLTHHVEHIVAKQHGGTEELDNLALACHRCNLRKGPNLTGIDPLTNEVVAWQDHFRVSTVRIEGITSIGRRATAQVLAMSDARRLDLRQELLGLGGFL
jgi:hypothetical protein